MDITNVENTSPAEVETSRFGIGGMSCEKCVARVEKALRGIGGVRDVKVDLGAALATVTFERDKTDVPALHDAVLKAGYKPSAIPQR